MEGIRGLFHPMNIRKDNQVILVRPSLGRDLTIADARTICKAVGEAYQDKQILFLPDEIEIMESKI